MPQMGWLAGRWPERGWAETAQVRSAGSGVGDCRTFALRRPVRAQPQDAPYRARVLPSAGPLCVTRQLVPAAGGVSEPGLERAEAAGLGESGTAEGCPAGAPGPRVRTRAGNIAAGAGHVSLEERVRGGGESTDRPGSSSRSRRNLRP